LVEVDGNRVFAGGRIEGEARQVVGLDDDFNGLSVAGK
jgi:hypothetical protein